MKSPVNYLSDADFSALPLSERVLHVARSQVGVSEVPKGSNWGPVIKMYLKAAGWLSPAAWCAAFMVWCIIVAGGKRSNLWTLGLASTWRVYEWAERNGRLRATPRRGDLFVWWERGGGHTGIVAEVMQQQGKLTVRTIEGNTNDEGSREGFEVCQRYRTVASIAKHDKFGFVSLGGLDQ